MIKKKFAILSAKQIFGMVGVFGEGTSSPWDDWTDEGVVNYNRIRDIHIIIMNKINNHYNKLEESILKNGVLNPIAITVGSPLVKQHRNLQSPIISKLEEKDRFFAEYFTGGSCLWIAQKHNLNVPCIINDKNDVFKGKEIDSLSELTSYFTNPVLNIRWANNIPCCWLIDTSVLYPKEYKLDQYDFELIREYNRIIDSRPLHKRAHAKYRFYNWVDPSAVNVHDTIHYLQPYYNDVKNNKYKKPVNLTHTVEKFRVKKK